MSEETIEPKIRNKRKYLNELRALNPLSGPTVVTGRMAKEIVSDRANGLTYAEIAIKHSISLSTALRYGSLKSKATQDARYRAKYLRNKNNPEYQEKVRQAMRRYYEREKEKNAKSQNTDV